jgi:hypothetical protein
MYAGDMQAQHRPATQTTKENIMAKRNTATPVATPTNGDEKDMTPRGKFLRLAGNRMSKIIDTVEQLGHLSNTAAYEYTKEDIDKMQAALSIALTATFRRFAEPGSKVRIAKPRSFEF